jgi:pimeloyl-ACP methyl ester carboxylesterase
VAIVALWVWSLPATPDAFYAAPEPLPAKPGTLLKSEAFTRSVPAGARAWRILYTTTRAGDVPAVASAIVVVADPTLPGPRPVIAWTHGTTGVATGCAPSLLADPFAHVPALAPLLAQGWVYVGSDYVGLGTPGPHPYLIGEGEARSALDAVRAARQMTELALDKQTVVWGHSQGGHAALWAAILAPRYAPDTSVVGVAAAAPASVLPALLLAAQDSIVGKILSSFVVRAYVDTYPEVGFDDIVRPGARLLVRDIARRCLAGRETLVSVAEAAMLATPIFAVDPRTGPFGRRLDENIPRAPIEVPVLIAQGLTDELVLPRLQEDYVKARCDAGQRLEYRRYEGRDHLSLVAPDSPLTADLVRWTQERIAGGATEPGCRIITR